MTGNVTAIFGGPTSAPEPVQSAIEALEAMLEKARSGHTIGVAVVGVCHDGCAEYYLAGHLGGYSVIGALEIAKAELMQDGMRE